MQKTINDAIIKVATINSTIRCKITIYAKSIPQGDAKIEIKLADLPDSIREAFGDKFTIRVKKK